MLNWKKRYRLSSIEDMTPESWDQEHKIIFNKSKENVSDEEWLANFNAQRSHVLQQDKLACPSCLSRQHDGMQERINSFYEGIKNNTPFEPKPRLIPQEEYDKAFEEHKSRQSNPQAWMKQFIEDHKHDYNLCPKCQAGAVLQNPFN